MHALWLIVHISGGSEYQSTISFKSIKVGDKVVFWGLGQPSVFQVKVCFCPGYLFHATSIIRCLLAFVCLGVFFGIEKEGAT